jgi:hypothetical protein
MEMSFRVVQKWEISGIDELLLASQEGFFSI